MQNRYKTVKVRWNPAAASQLEDLEIESSTPLEYRDTLVNLDKIAFLDEYEGKICINFSAMQGDILITDLDYTDTNLSNLA